MRVQQTQIPGGLGAGDRTRNLSRAAADGGEEEGTLEPDVTQEGSPSSSGEHLRGEKEIRPEPKSKRRFAGM